MTDEQAARVAAEREEQGFGPTVTDVTALAAVGRVVGQAVSNE